MTVLVISRGLGWEIACHYKRAGMVHWIKHFNVDDRYYFDYDLGNLKVYFGKQILKIVYRCCFDRWRPLEIILNLTWIRP